VKGLGTLQLKFAQFLINEIRAFLADAD